MTENDVEILSKTELYSGYARLYMCTLRHRLHDGGWTQPFTREILERGRVVGVLPYDPIRDQVVLLEQFRLGAFAAGRAAWQIEIVAGVIEAGEHAEAVAVRETREECGLDVLALMPIAETLTTPGMVSESATLYCARIDAENAGGVHGLAHEHEDIRVFALPALEAIAWADNGRILLSTALIALYWLARNRDRLRAAWR